MDAITGSDRCDRCGAQAAVRTKHDNRKTLLWCAHHFREHEEALTPYLVTYQAQTTDEFKEFARP